MVESVKVQRPDEFRPTTIIMLDILTRDCVDQIPTDSDVIIFRKASDKLIELDKLAFLQDINLQEDVQYIFELGDCDSRLFDLCQKLKMKKVTFCDNFTDKMQLNTINGFEFEYLDVSNKQNFCKLGKVRCFSLTVEGIDQKSIEKSKSNFPSLRKITLIRPKLENLDYFKGYDLREIEIQYPKHIDIISDPSDFPKLERLKIGGTRKPLEIKLQEKHARLKYLSVYCLQSEDFLKYTPNMQGLHYERLVQN